MMMVMVDPVPEPKREQGFIPYVSEYQAFQYHYEEKCGFGEVFSTKDSALTFYKQMVKQSKFVQESPYNQIIEVKLDSVLTK
jgi:hypothetical protein